MHELRSEPVLQNRLMEEDRKYATGAYRTEILVSKIKSMITSSHLENNLKLLYYLSNIELEIFSELRSRSSF